MIEKIAVSLVSQMLEEKLINQERMDFYVYAFITMSERFITVSTILLISFVLKIFLPTVFFLIFFFSLRKRTGGYHANTFWQCYLYTVITYIVILLVYPFFINNPIIMLGLLTISALAIIMIGTINHPNMDMDKHELGESKKLARLMTTLECSIIIFSLAIKINLVCICFMAIAIILCSMLLCVAKLLKQEV